MKDVTEMRRAVLQCMVVVILLTAAETTSPYPLNTDIGGRRADTPWRPAINRPTWPGDDGQFSKCNLSVCFTPDSAQVYGNISLDLYNNDPVTFDSIPFHLYPSGMKSLSRNGCIDVLDVLTLVDGKTVGLNFTVQGQQLMWVNLSRPWHPSGHVRLLIRFVTTLPDGGIDRANVYGSHSTQDWILKFASSYPVPCVYDQRDGWNTEPYTFDADPFYFDMAYYRLNITAPEDVVIAATGLLRATERHGQWVTYAYDSVLPVREVTFSASPYFLTESRAVNGVNVTAFYLPSSEALWEHTAVNITANALALYNHTFGTYPYPALNVVEEHSEYGGMEYPCQVYISHAVSQAVMRGNSDPSMFEAVVAHELAHQWWYQLVGNDEYDEGFLDEGLACWSENYYAEVYYGSWTAFQQTELVDLVRHYHAQSGLPCRINQSTDEYPGNYLFAAYVKAPVVLEKLRQLVGHNMFVLALQQYFEDNEFGIATLQDLQRAFEDSVHRPLDWFFNAWYDNPYLPRYEVTSATWDTSTRMLVMTVEDTNAATNRYPYRQELLVRVTSETNIVYEAWQWINGSHVILGLPVPQQPTYVFLVLADLALAQTCYGGQEPAASIRPVDITGDGSTTEGLDSPTTLLVLGGLTVAGTIVFVVLLTKRVRRPSPQSSIAPL